MDLERCIPLVLDILIRASRHSGLPVKCIIIIIIISFGLSITFNIRTFYLFFI